MPILKRAAYNYSPNKEYAEEPLTDYSVENVVNRSMRLDDQAKTAEEARLARLRGTKNISRADAGENFDLRGSKHARRLRNSIIPWDYELHQNPWEFGSNYFSDKNTADSGSLVMDKTPASSRRYDAFSLYMGQPQRSDTFTASKYRPKTGYDDFKQMYTFKDPKMLNKYLYSAQKYGLLDKIRKGEITKDSPLSDRQLVFKDTENNIMNNATMGVGYNEKGEPYLSVADKWDLSGYDMMPGNPGKPWMLYDRIPLNEKLMGTLKGAVPEERLRRPGIVESMSEGDPEVYSTVKANPNRRERKKLGVYGTTDDLYYDDYAKAIEEAKSKPEVRKRGVLYKGVKDRKNYVNR